MRLTLLGVAPEAPCVDCEALATVGELRTAISEEYGIDGFSLCFASRRLSDGEVLGESLVDGAAVGVTVDLLGGAKKRKKKTYTTPKKIKHKNKKVKLAVLKFYKVDPNGEVTRLRPECPGKNCGAGVFMAKHHGRTACGRCGMTYIINKDN